MLSSLPPVQSIQTGKILSLDSTAAYNQLTRLFDKHAPQKQIAIALHDIIPHLQQGVLKTEQTDRIQQIASSILKSWFSSHTESVLAERIILACTLRQQNRCVSIEDAEKCIEQFRYKENRELAEKWKKGGLDLRAFVYNPDLAEFVVKVHLHNSIPYWGHQAQFDEASRSLLIPINRQPPGEKLTLGNYENLRDFVQGCTAEKVPFASGYHIVSKEPPRTPWTYTGFGLRPRSDWEWNKLEPSAQLTPEQVEYAQSKARLAAKGVDLKAKKEQKYVVEIVGSYVPAKTNALNAGLYETLLSPSHTWLRIIAPDGTFYSVGFNLGTKLVSKTELGFGLFRTPDPFEGLPNLALITAGILVTEAQCKALIGEIETRQDSSTKTPFQFLEHNCTRFIQHLFDTLDIHNIVKKESSKQEPQAKPGAQKDSQTLFEDVIEEKSITKPVLHARISELLFKILPPSVQKAEKKTYKVLKPVVHWLKQITPPFIRKIFEVFTAIIRLAFERILLGISGRGFAYSRKGEFPTEEKDPHEGIPWYKFGTHIKIAAEKRLVRPFVPAKLIAWLLDRKEGVRIIPASRGFTGPGATPFPYHYPAKNKVS